MRRVDVLIAMTARPAPHAEPNFEALRLRLSALRHERGFTYDELSERTGVARTTLVALETGFKRQARPERVHTRGSLESWWRIARALDVPLSELLDSLNEAPINPAEKA